MAARTTSSATIASMRNNWFANRAGQPLPSSRRNNYGFTIGGPIIKNKTFFFDYDRLRSSRQSTASGAVPTDLMRAGDFGEVCAAQGGSFDGTGRCTVDAGQIWDPYLRHHDPNSGGAVANTPNNFIPFNNVSKYISPGCNPLFLATGHSCPPANLEPAPGVAGNLIDSVAQKMMSVKYSYQYSHGKGLDCFKNFTDPCQGGPGWTNAHLFAINDTHTFIRPYC